MKEESLVSVIVPVYNAEKYIEQCIDSIISQTYKNIELILVDDGSTDLSSEICKKYSKENEKVIYIKKKNTGVSDTRNIGIECARGKFLIFIDADDFVEERYIETLIINYEPNTIVSLNYKIYCNNNFIDTQDIFIKSISYEEILAYIIGGNRGNFFLGYMYRAVWGKIFESNIIKQKKIKFNNKLKIGEDSVFLIEYFKFIKNIKVVNKKYYNYRENEYSVTHRINNDLFKQSEEQLGIYIQKMKEMGLLENKIIQIGLKKFSMTVFNNLIINEIKMGQKSFKESKLWVYNNKYIKDKNIKIKKNGKIYGIENILFIFLKEKIAITISINMIQLKYKKIFY